MWHVYIVRCADDTLYTGTTTDVIRRLAQHNAGTGAKYTRGRGPVELLVSKETQTRSEALKLEAYIKRCDKDDKVRTLDEWKR